MTTLRTSGGRTQRGPNPDRQQAARGQGGPEPGGAGRVAFAPYAGPFLQGRKIAENENSICELHARV
jgi:hypothetical protein